MKKLIALIGALNLYVSAILPITSCSEEVKEKKESENETDPQTNNKNSQLNDDAKTQVQELNIASMLEEGIDAEDILTTNSTVSESIEMFNEKAQNINENLVFSSQNEETDYEQKLKQGDSNIKIIVKNVQNENDEIKVTAKIKNTHTAEIDNAHFTGILDGLFNKQLDGKEYSVLNTYEDVLGLIKEQVIQIENNINIKLVNESELNTKLTTTENKINVQFYDDKNSVNKEVKIINVQRESFFTIFKNGAMKIKSLGHSIAERTKNTFSKIDNIIKSVGGKIKDTAGALKTKIEKALKDNKQDIEIAIEIDGSVEMITISIAEDKENIDLATKKLIIDILDNFALNTASLTTNDKLGGIIPIVQSHISGIKSAHEYNVSIATKDKIKHFKASNKIKITFTKRKEANIKFSHEINVGINNTTSKINVSSLPKSH